MLKKRIVPKLLIRHRQVGRSMRPVLVTTRGYTETIEVGDPVSQAKIYEAQMADELIVLNIDGTPIGGDEMMLDLIARLASETFMPLAVGGGVRTVEDFGTLLGSGADKVSVNQAALENPALIGEAAGRYGAQVVVVSIDYRTVEGAPQVFVDSASKPTGRTPQEWAKEAVSRGAGEILLTNADRDGMGSGLDIDIAREIADSVDVPLILSGGCGLGAHFAAGFIDGGAEAVAAGTYFCFRDQNPFQARSHIANAGVPIRMEV
ncbi:imidazole glycerol phosphate synthase subunit HisF [Tsuneonella amylolytica]|uniref:imidazole glycerol phosphate synthase subunit HisF n=1 Tax=Tsuneonella amylolytica TaxID=2338327 RepID=UPI000EA8E423|nr:imidazole glycerol phosphate synthase cyclase subunit [Tsuneonella amylolytica]